MENITKRGRKKKSEQDRVYFGEEQERAVVDYLNQTSAEDKNKIYREKLQEPIGKMVHIIVRRYKIYYGHENINDIEMNVLSHTIEQLSKFKPEKGTKAYSYLGTVAKNNALLISKTLYKKDTRFLDFDQFYNDETENNAEYQVGIEEDYSDYTSIKLKKIISEIKNNMEENSKLDKKEKLVAHSLLNILENINMFFHIDEKIQTKKINIFNRQRIILIIKEQTNLTSKEIKAALLTFVNLYNNVLKEIMSDF